MKWCVCTSQNNKLGCGVHCVWLADNKLRWVRCRTDLPEQNRRLCRAVGDPSQPDDSVIVLQKLITLPFKIRVSFVCRRVPLPGSVIVPVPLFLRCCAALMDPPPPTSGLSEMRRYKNLLSFGLWKHKTLVTPIKDVVWASLGWRGATERSLGRAQLHLNKADSGDTNLTPPVTASPQQWFLVH